jgi:putative ABC transport system permease protein
MPLLTTIRVAFRSLRANMLRSLLAVLGIVIGIAAVISMLAMGAGAQSSIMSRISSMGTNLLSVHPGHRSFGGVRSGEAATLTVDDARAILDGIDTIEAVSPVVRGGEQLKFGDLNTDSSVYGTAVTWPSIRDFQLQCGRFFTEQETNGQGRVVVIGSQTAEDLGITADTLGENIKIKGIAFRLIGIFKEKGSAGFFSSDSLAVVPYTTAMGILFGEDSLSEVSMRIRQDADVEQVKSQIESLLGKRHNIPNPDENDFEVFSQTEIMETASSATRTFTVLLGTIASISLVVGGIGIMNIMLVTVTERTREIGIRKAIGAKERDVLLQFLCEAVLMCMTGGLIGVGLGIAASNIIAKATQFQTSIQIPVILIALLFSVSVGMFFGYYPARRAALLDPVDALSYE